MKKVTKKDKRRLSIAFIVALILFSVLASNVFSIVSQIYTNIRDKKELDNQYASILKKEETLKSEIEKLQDPEYIARYAREKYLYSKNGELIIKIDE